MRRPLLAMSLVALAGASPGCCSTLNVWLLQRRPLIEQAPGKVVHIELLKIVASSNRSDRIDLVAVYADGKAIATTLRADGLGSRSGSVRWPTPSDPRIPIRRDPQIPIRRDPGWEGDGLSLRGGKIRWTKPGKVLAQFSPAR